MDPMVVDVLVCLDGDQCSDRTLLADAVGAEALFLPVIGRDICGGCVPYVSDVIQSIRCSLMAKRLFEDVGVRLFLRLLVGVLSKFCRNLFGLSGFDPKRTVIDKNNVEI